MSEILREFERMDADAEARIKLVKLDLKEQRAASSDDRVAPGTVVGARSAYELHVDGAQVGWMTYEGGYGNGRWRVYSLQHAEKRDWPETLYGSCAGRHGKVLMLSGWLANKYNPDRYPTKAIVEERKLREAAEAKAREMRRALELQQRLDTAVHALAGLEEITKIGGLTKYQADALEYAIKGARDSVTSLERTVGRNGTDDTRLDP